VAATIRSTTKPIVHPKNSTIQSPKLLPNFPKQCSIHSTIQLPTHPWLYPSLFDSIIELIAMAMLDVSTLVV